MANGLKLNGGLKSFDLSWNSLGSGKPGLIGEALGRALSYENLFHLDLSYNKLSKVDCLLMGDYLKSNHKLFGLHLEGNQGCYLDSLGFVKAFPENKLGEEI